MLERMRRGYTRQAYDDLVAHVREVIPGVALSTDVISGLVTFPYKAQIYVHAMLYLYDCNLRVIYTRHRLLKIMHVYSIKLMPCGVISCLQSWQSVQCIFLNDTVASIRHTWLRLMVTLLGTVGSKA